MKNAKIPLIICGIITLALIAGLLIVQFLYPLPASPSKVYNLIKTSSIIEFDHGLVEETNEDGEKSPIKIIGITVELADYENLSRPAYFYSFETERNYVIAYFSNGEKKHLTADTAKNEEAIELSYGELDKFEKIISNMRFDVPNDNDTVKVYLTTTYGYYLCEYTRAEFEASVFADTYILYGSNY